MQTPSRTLLSATLALVLCVACPPSEDPPSSQDQGDQDQGDVPGDSAVPPDQSAPIFITTMTHLEGNWDYGGPQGQAKFDMDVATIQLAMDTFDAHGALLTVESEIPFSSAASDQQSDIFTQLMDRGHGVGTHCDITPDQPVLPVAEFAGQFTERKVLMDGLIGAENNLGCSGGQGRNDWIAGADLAGFKFVDGIVGFAFLSMPLENRPEGWTDDYILKEGHFHDNVPLALEDRIHPFMMEDATDLVPDVPGKVLLSAGSLGRLDGFGDAEQGESCNPACTLDDEDVEAAFLRIDEALAVHDPARVGKIDVYFPLSTFKTEKIPYIYAFLSRLKADYIDTGKLEWATQRDIYEAYVSWNTPGER